MPKPECPACIAEPHAEPDMPHIHLTEYGYLVFTPDHRMRDYIEEIRNYERGEAARLIREELVAMQKRVEEKVSDRKLAACQKIGLSMASLKVIEMAEGWASRG